MGTALILLIWLYLRPVLHWYLWGCIALTVLGGAIALFGLTFTIYFFSLDLKLLALLEGPLGKIQDKMKRDKGL